MLAYRAVAVTVLLQFWLCDGISGLFYMIMLMLFQLFRYILLHFVSLISLPSLDGRELVLK